MGFLSILLDLDEHSRVYTQPINAENTLTLIDKILN